MAITRRTPAEPVSQVGKGSLLQLTPAGHRPPLARGRVRGAHRAIERSKRRRMILGIAVLLVLLAGITEGAKHLVAENIGGKVTRVPDVFGAVGDGPRPPGNEAVTFLLVGSDSRSTEATTRDDVAFSIPASERGDVIMLARLNSDRTSAAVVSIPRDSWVEIPGRGRSKINAAYAFGGPSLLIQTVEQLTGIRVDHFAVVDFAGFRAVVDSVGGVDVQIATATSNDGVAFEKGLNHLDGTEALAYVRQREGLPRGDLDRAQRQQNLLRAMLEKTESNNVLFDPARAYNVVDAVSRSVSVDDTLSNAALRELQRKMRALRPGDVSFVGAPVRGPGREGRESVIYLDELRSARLWDALRTDSWTAYVRLNPADSLRLTPP